MVKMLKPNERTVRQVENLWRVCEIINIDARGISITLCPADHQAFNLEWRGGSGGCRIARRRGYPRALGSTRAALGQHGGRTGAG